jgi:hypothetical protein
MNSRNSIGRCGCRGQYRRLRPRRARLSLLNWNDAVSGDLAVDCLSALQASLEAHPAIGAGGAATIDGPRRAARRCDEFRRNCASR